jgi:nitrogen fixation NifU-like protein
VKRTGIFKVMKEISQMHEMYHPGILEYAQDSRRWIVESSSQHVIKAYNPLCGDKYEIRFDLQEVIKAPVFHGYGCILSKASHAALLDLVDGMSPEAAINLIDHFIRATKGEEDAIVPDDRLLPFLQVHKYPSRLDCVLLGWTTLQAKLLRLQSFKT